MTRPYAVIVAHPLLVIRVLSSGQDVLVAQVVGLLVQYPGPTLYPDWIAVAKVDVKLRTVTVALIISTLEVLFFIKDDLCMKKYIGMEELACSEGCLNLTCQTCKSHRITGPVKSLDAFQFSWMRKCSQTFDWYCMPKMTMNGQTAQTNKQDQIMLIGC